MRAADVSMYGTRALMAINGSDEQMSSATTISGSGGMAMSSNGERAISGGTAVLSWLLQLVTAGILVQTLFFKFTASVESVYIFSTLGMEPWGRIGSGVAELIAAALLLAPRTAPLGALLALGVISGAIMSHLTKLGIVVKDDGGLLFALALVVFVSSTAILALRRRQGLALARRVLLRSGR